MAKLTVDLSPAKRQEVLRYAAHHDLAMPTAYATLIEQGLEAEHSVEHDSTER
jgi:hypothetical protein